VSDPRMTAAAIRPLVSHQQTQGRHLIITFTCPVKRTHVQARYSAPQSSGVMNTVSRHAQSTMMYEVRRQVLTMIRSFMGYGFAGQIASTAAGAAMSGMPMGSSGPAGLSSAEIETGLVEAFKSVSGQFVWTGDRWVSRAAAPQIEPGPQLGGMLGNRYDQVLLARMMLEVARADDDVTDEESSHLSEAIDPSLGSITSLAARPPLTRAELAEASPGPMRQSMLAAAWAVALCDEHEHERERALLEGYAAGLGLDAEETRRRACALILDQALERAFSYGGHDVAARDQLYALGERIGMSRLEVERAEARYQKRKLG
jgi:hypothetical protein